MKMTWLHIFLGLFFIPANGRAKLAQQLKTRVRLFHPIYFSWEMWIVYERACKNILNPEAKIIYLIRINDYTRILLEVLEKNIDEHILSCTACSWAAWCLSVVMNILFDPNWNLWPRLQQPQWIEILSKGAYILHTPMCSQKISSSFI